MSVDLHQGVGSPFDFLYLLQAADTEIPFQMGDDRSVTRRGKILQSCQNVLIGLLRMKLDQNTFCIRQGGNLPFTEHANRMFRTLGSEHMKPADIATRMNNALTENNEQGMFVTMFMGLINLKTGRMDYCNAGHNPPVMGYPPKFMEVESNAPIGLWPGLEFVGETIENIKGVPLFLYSDGLNEAENKEQVQFGDDRIIEILSDKSLDNAKKVVLKLMAEVEQHRNGAEPNDDLTMLCLRVD